MINTQFASLCIGENHGSVLEQTIQQRTGSGLTKSPTHTS